MTSKTYTFIHYGFANNKPRLTLQPQGSTDFEHLMPSGQTLTFMFDPTMRFCTGWHDLQTGQSFACPDAAALPAPFTQCRRCQNKTGFNPAFYHAASVSVQQQKRNAQPHFLYLAHFAPGVVKVGISWAERGLARLLDQGARSGLVLKTYPSAMVARQYEAKIAGLPGIAETLQATTKYKLLGLPYNADQGHQELLQTRDRIVQQVGLTPDANDPRYFDAFYVQDFEPHNFTQVNQPQISGRCIGMIGGMFVAAQDGAHFGLGLGQFLGCAVTVGQEQIANSAAPQQVRLF